MKEFIGNGRAPARLIALAIVAAGALSASVAEAQVPGNAYDYTRTTAFTWQPNGAAQTQTVEPNNPASCSLTTYGYDAYGNRSTTTVANCGGATGRAKFPTRAASASYGSVTVAVTVATSSVNVTVPDGVLRATSTNALQQQAIERYDPRFGLPLSGSDPNGIGRTWKLDDFGRVTMEVHQDTTRMLYAHCVIAASGLDTTSNSSTANGDPLTCPTLPTGQAPADALSFLQSELHNAQGAKIGSFTRTFYDRLGRTLRVATEPFDGAGQPSSLVSTVKVLDTIYSAYGMKVLETQPYFLLTQSSTTSGNGDVGLTRTDFDDLGRATAIYVADSKGHAGTQTYGAFGTRTSAQSTTAYAGLNVTSTNDLGQTRVVEGNANGDTSRITDANNAQIAYLHDAFGNVVSTRDALQNQILTQFDLLGHSEQVNDPDKGVLVSCYDALGQIKALQTPKLRGSGASDCPNIDDVAVDASGKTATTVTNFVTIAYDVLGRMAQRIEPESKTTWSYDNYAGGTSCGAGIGQLCEVVTSTGEDRTYLYDAYGRPSNQRTSLSGGPSFASVWAYDATTQQLGTRTYPTGVQVGYNYTALGFLQNAVLRTAAQVNPLPNAQGQTAASQVLAANSTLWSASVVNAWSSVEKESFGNGVAATTTYDAYSGRTTAVGAGASGAVLSQSYVWDSLGRMSSRADANGAGDGNAVSESFGYADNVGRLTTYTVSAPAIAGLTRTVNLQYNALGMLLYKSDVGNYTYGAQNTAGVRPHALASMTGVAGTVSYLYDSDGNLATADGGKYRALTYNSFDLPDSQSGIAGPAGSPTYKWVYDESHARLIETHVDASGTRTTWSLHPDNAGGLAFESESAPGGVISNRHYVGVAGRNIAVLVSTGALPTLTAGQMAPPALACGTTCITLVKVEYWHSDSLGSLITTTDHTGAVTQRYAYDPFGKRRFTNGNYDAAGNLVYDWSPSLNSGTDRGFTGQEQLDDVGLVHMNGRIFDATLGVFLQADPHITNPGDLQNYNRYGYCHNNPLSCTDPSGLDWCPPDCTVTINGNSGNSGDSQLSDSGSWGGGGLNSGPSWFPSMWKTVFGGSSRGAQTQSLTKGNGGAKAGFTNTCLAGTTKCTKADVPAIRQAALACHNNLDCIDALRPMAFAAGLPVPPVDFKLAVGGFLEEGIQGGLMGALFAPGLSFDTAVAKEWTGYIGVDADGVIRYVGITGRDAAERWAEHVAADPAKAALDWFANDLTKFSTETAARVWEQTEINANGLMKYGGTLLNKINSIAPKYWSGLGIQ